MTLDIDAYAHMLMVSHMRDMYEVIWSAVFKYAIVLEYDIYPYAYMLSVDHASLLIVVPLLQTLSRVHIYVYDSVRFIMLRNKNSLYSE